MKISNTKKVVSVALAASMLLSAQAMATSVFAATTPKATIKVATSTKTQVKPIVPALKIESVELTIDGKKLTVETVTQSAGLLVNVRTFAATIGATMSFDNKTKTLTIKKDANTLLVKADDKYVQHNGAKKFITHAPRIVQAKTFVEIEQLTRLLGGEVLTDDEGGKEYSSVKLLVDVVNPHWLNASNVLVSKETEVGFDHFTINTDTRKSIKLNISVVTDNLIPSHDGKHVAYTDENSNVYIYTIEGNVEKKITEDVSEKLELQWASDNLSLFYIDGPSSNVIANITLEGTITKIVDDKVNYKSDLFVHSDNKQLLYTVTKTSKVTTDTSGVKEGEDLPDFEVVIDPTGTEPQLFSYDSAAATPAVKALTTSLENKTFSTMLSNGSVVYLSTDTVTEGALPTIKVIDKDLRMTTIILANVDLISMEAIGDKLIAHGFVIEEGEEDTQYIYEIDPIKGSAKKLAKLPLEISDIVLGAAKDQVLAKDENGRLAVWKNNQWFFLTKSSI